jgi:hypothetical protein
MTNMETLPTDLQAIMDDVLDLIRKRLAKGDEVPPSFFLINRERHTVLPIIAPWTNDDEKYATAKIIRRQAKTIGSDCVIFVCEAWGRTIDKNNATDQEALARLIKHGRVRDEPDRRDVLMITVETRGKTWGAMPEVTTGGKTRELASIEWRVYDGMEGKLASFLSPPAGAARH